VIAKAASALARGEDYDHPVLDSPGWWHRPPRLYPWSGSGKPAACDGRKLLITGATGTLGNAFGRACDERALPFHLTPRAELDITDPASIGAAIEQHQPWAVINTAGFVRVADAEAEREACFAWNADGAENLAQACAAAGIPLVTFSSDLVFDGSVGRPLLESDEVSPANVYGASKAEAERRVLAAQEEALIIRTAAFFGPWDRYNFAWQALSAVSEGRTFRASRTNLVSPTYVPDLCHASLDLLVDGEKGLWHLANEGGMRWYDLAVRLAEHAGFDPLLIEPEDGPVADNRLASVHGAMLRPADAAIADYVNAVREQFAAPTFSVAAE
jgi:dTDP-4-dehydrorhamnose reductase